jgi:epoxyqueuosine reductase QueG
MDKILTLACELFDAVGYVNNYIIVGLEQRRDRNLDEITKVNEEFELVGYKKFFQPKILRFLSAIIKAGYKAKQLRDGKTNMKDLMVKAGVGKWGKNSLVIHETFGPWLRFALIETNFDFGRAKQDARAVFPACESCNACVDACVLGTLQPFKIEKPENCMADLQGELAFRCDSCLKACPIGVKK